MVSSIFLVTARYHTFRPSFVKLCKFRETLPSSLSCTLVRVFFISILKMNYEQVKLFFSLALTLFIVARSLQTKPYQADPYICYHLHGLCLTYSLRPEKNARFDSNQTLFVPPNLEKIYQHLHLQ
jgi:hypothetical protein